MLTVVGLHVQVFVWFSLHFKHTQKCFHETRNCCVMHSAHYVWPENENGGRAWTQTARARASTHTHTRHTPLSRCSSDTHTHTQIHTTHTHKHVHTHTVTLSRPESFNVRLWKVLTKGFPRRLLITVLEKGGQKTNQPKNGSSYLRIIGTTAKTLQSPKPPHRHQQNLKQFHRRNNNHIWQPRQQGLSPCAAKYPPPPAFCVSGATVSGSVTVSECPLYCTRFGH